MKNYDTYIFDLDGTLLDTLTDLFLSVNATMRLIGYAERTREEVRSFVGNGIRLLILRAMNFDETSLQNFESKKDFERAFQFFKDYYAQHLCDNTAPYSGVMDMLKRLKVAGKKIAVVSNKADFATKELCRHYFGGLVDIAVGENETAGIRKKPAPDSVYSVIKEVGGESAVYIGDSEVDIETAKNANLPCISVCWGFKDKEFLESNGASKLVSYPDEIF